jgi:hypothetical protein
MTMAFDAFDAFPHDDPPTLIRRRPAGMERRAGVRLPIEMDVSVEGGAQRFQAMTADISRTGMFVTTQRMIPIGAHVMLAFTLPNGIALEVLGVVQRHACDGVGLSFFCLEPNTKRLLEAFCEAREPLYYGEVSTAH